MQRKYTVKLTLITILQQMVEIASAGNTSVKSDGKRHKNISFIYILFLILVYAKSCKNGVKYY